MKGNIKLLVFVFFYIFLTLRVEEVFAVPFSVTVVPSVIDEGVKNQRLSFIVTNEGNVKIVQLDITLPQGITFTGTSDSNITHPFIALTTIPSWSNLSAEGILDLNETGNFTIFVNTKGVSGINRIKITVLDETNQANSTEVDVTVIDKIPPTYSNVTVSPQSNSLYAEGVTYWFNISWEDNVEVSTVLIEHNFTGSLVNNTMEKEGSVYYFKVVDLPAGVYTWKVYANDTNSTPNWNSTPRYTYTIAKAASTMDVYFNDFLNSNILVKVNNEVNIRVDSSCKQAGCEVIIRRDGGKIVFRGPVPITYVDNITSTSLYTYSIEITGNQNYSSIAKDFKIFGVPEFSLLTSLSQVYSPSRMSWINLTFEKDPGLNFFISWNWTGNFTNYTMVKISPTEFAYNTILPAGTTNWRIYGKYGKDLFYLNDWQISSVAKAIPNITLIALPGWNLNEPVQSNVSCKIEPSDLEVKLYRDNALVTNPDVQTFSWGTIHVYICNSTETSNYEKVEVIGILKVRPEPFADFIFEEFPTLIEVRQNTSIIAVVKIKNTGNVDQNITLAIEGINKDWFEIKENRKLLLPNDSLPFYINFSISGDTEFKEYDGKFVATSENLTVSKDFKLKVLPSNSTLQKMNETLLFFDEQIGEVEKNITLSKVMGLNTSLIEEKLRDVKLKLNETKDLFYKDEYWLAYKNFDSIEASILEIRNLLNALHSGKIVKETYRAWFYLILVVIISVPIVFLFLVKYKLKARPEAIKYEEVPVKKEEKEVEKKTFIPIFHYQGEVEKIERPKILKKKRLGESPLEKLKI